MSQPVNVPAVGPVQRRWVIWGGLAVLALVGYAYWQRSRQSGTMIDPSTGTMDAGDGGYQNPAPTSPPSGLVDDPNVISSNDEWARRAVDALTSIGFNAQYAATTIGRYLSGQELSPEEADVVRTAFALVGEPPNQLALVVRQQPNGPTPSSGTESRAVSEGNRVSDVVASVRSYRPTYSEAELLQANPGASVARANANGYISASNPDKGDSYWVFSANQNVVVPAR